jgi:hypothetical protein
MYYLLHLLVDYSDPSARLDIILLRTVVSKGRCKQAEVNQGCEHGEGSEGKMRWMQLQAAGTLSEQSLELLPNKQIFFYLLKTNVGRVGDKVRGYLREE